MSWNEETIRERLKHDDKWVCHAIVMLHSRQTSEERDSGQARKRNGMGFNSTDSFFFSRLAEFYHDNGYLTKLQITAARKGGIGKYWKQVLEVIKANERIKEERIKNETEKHLSVPTELGTGHGQGSREDRVRQSAGNDQSCAVGGDRSEDREFGR